jgi:type VI secretion system protein ImpA
MNISLAPPVSSTNEMLLQPIDPILPVGTYLRYDPHYDRIAQARLTEDASLPQGVWQRPTLQADWRLVEELCIEALVHRTKDLQIALWLTEAWLHLEGLAGYSRGTNLILELHHCFVDTMHPAPELAERAGPYEISLPLSAVDPAVEQRANLIRWFNEKLSLQVKLLPLSSPSAASGATSFSLADLEGALYQEQIQRRQGPNPSFSGVNAFERSLALTPPDLLANTWTELRQAIDITNQLDDYFDICYGSANGGLLTLKGVFDRMALAIAPALPEEEQMQDSNAENADDIGIAGSEVGSSIARLTYEPATVPRVTSHLPHAHCACTPIQSRDDAYSRLAEISEFLRKIEPHSPVPYLLQRAIAWGGLNFSELLPELLRDQAALQEVGDLLRLSGSNGNLTNK